MELDLLDDQKLMGLCKKDVTPLLMHWSYILIALTHRNVLQDILALLNKSPYCVSSQVSINLLRSPKVVSWSLDKSLPGNYTNTQQSIMSQNDLCIFFHNHVYNPKFLRNNFGYCLLVKPGQKGCHFADISKCIFLYFFFFQILLKFLP